MSKILEETTELEQKSGAVTSRAFAESGGRAGEAAPVLEYEEIPTRKTETKDHVRLGKKKSRRRGLIALAALIAITGAGAAAYSLGVFSGIGGVEGVGIENITKPPEGAKIPAFSPIDPADFLNAIDENYIIVPDETGLELPAFGHEPQVTAKPQNHYTQTPNVSSFFTRAAQDESFVYFLQGPPSGEYGLCNLMRASISTGKAESVSNANEVSGSIYSFTLYGQNIITCEQKQNTETFAFYRVPKSGVDAQLLFETDSPAYMNVFDSKIFMLFVEDKALGVFDLEADTQPAYISLEPLDDAAHYFPQFSVLNGYLYYGVWYKTDAETDVLGRTEYMRRSLYTGETVVLLSGESGDSIWNPCWDTKGNAYYTQYDSEAMKFCFVSVKDGENPQIISVFDRSGDGTWPLLSFKDEFLVAAQPPDGLRKYDFRDFSVELESPAESQPFAATKDYLVADKGIYRLFDFAFIPF